MNYDALKVLYDEGKYSDVIKSSVNILNSDSSPNNSVDIYNLLGLSYFHIKEYDNSISSFNLGIQIDDQSYLLHQNIGYSYLELKDNKKALNSFNKSLALNSNSFLSCIGIAKCNFFLNNFDEAIKFYNAGILIKPNISDPYLEIFACFFQLKDYKSASEILMKAYNTCDQDDIFLNQLSQCYFKLSNFEKSQELLIESLNVNSNNRITYELLCDLFKMNKQLDIGVNFFNNRISNDNSNSYDYFSLSKLYYFMNDAKSLLKYSDLGLAINNNDYIHLNLLGAYYLSNKLLIKSEETLIKSIDINPNYIQSYANLSSLYYAMHEYEKCLNITKKGLNLDPNNKIMLFIAGKLLKDSKNYKEAVKYITKSKFNGWEEIILECLYFDSNYDDFISFLNKNLSKVSTSRAVSSFCTHLTHNTGIKTKHNFCKNPFDYIKYFDLDSFDNLPDINTRLLNEINLYDMGTRNQPLLVGGQQTTTDIFSQDSPLLSNFKSFLLDYVKIYRNIFVDSDDLFIRNWPDRFNLTGWCVQMNKNGYLHPHNHPKGWVSGCYYIKIPDKNNASEGNIEFSLSNSNFPPNKTKLSTLEIETIDSRLILFPSSLYHKTLPFSDDTNRICIAFDFEQNNII